MKDFENPKVNMETIEDRHIQILFQTLADIVGEKEGFEAKVTVKRKTNLERK